MRGSKFQTIIILYVNLKVNCTLIYYFLFTLHNCHTFAHILNGITFNAIFYFMFIYICDDLTPSLRAKSKITLSTAGKL